MLSRFAFVLLLTATSSAMCGQANMGGVSINLPSPPGFCDLSNGEPSDKRMLTIIGDLLTKSGNQLLSMSADCGQLANWRAGRQRLLDDYAQYQTSLALVDRPPAESIEQTCNTLREEGNKIVSREIPDVKARVEAALKNTKINQTTFIGVLAEEPRACYAGLVQQIHTQAG
ncbi:MAG TPA: hypothetical protein VE986_04495, partial [Hyphomicrobiales bacterium]|nr:hypothetical protein [Hyphomicrobiales bacterium]